MNNLVLPFCLIITTLCVVQALYGIAQYMRLFPAFGGHRITGSFDNPAGFAACLCTGFPFFFRFLTKKEKWIRSVFIGGMMIIGLAVLLSGSRAGMLTWVIVCFAGFSHLFRISAKHKIIVGIFLAIPVTGLYFVKKDSADGRLLIWRCSWEMIKDKPVTGYGIGGFKAEYMNYQAKYFEEYPNSKQAMLADNVNRPFNEYIELLVNYGLVGFLLFTLLLFYLIRAYKRNSGKTPLTHIACWCLTAVAVFAFFSYPLRYPFVWVMGLLSCSIILFQGNNRRFLFKKVYISILILLLMPMVCLKSYNRLSAEIRWCAVAHRSLAGQTKQMLPEYQLLYSELQNNELFLYNYAAELNFAQCYKESLSVAHECERLWADYDLQILMADSYLQIKDYAAAEHYYWKAATMCPVRFVPLYKLFQLYETIGDKENMRKTAKTIIDKPVKVMSPIVNQIKNEVKRKTDCL
ncbi:MAG: O-antigen ligase family protein [Candidatus Azobacteroides sp.]|nr:O-antigen ligase family protein [Candidatus Azobacteroides sp.]